MRTPRASALVRWITILASIVAAVAIAVFIFVRITRPLITVTDVVEGPVVQAFYATGTLEADREYEIKTSVAGVVKQVLRDKGDRVKAGETLAIVVDDAPQTERDQVDAEAAYDLKKRWAEENTSPLLRDFDQQIERIQQRLKLAQTEAERYQKVLAQNAGSQSDLDRAANAVLALVSEQESLKQQRTVKQAELEMDRDAAKKKLDLANRRLERVIVSPIDGVVLDRPSSQGTRLEINGHIMQVADVTFDKLVMRAQVDEENKADLRSGQKVLMTLYTFPGRVFSGRVSKIYPKADPTRRTFEVDVAVEQPEINRVPTAFGTRLVDSDEARSLRAFSAGMTGELEFIMEEKASARVVPSQAVQGGTVWAVRAGEIVKPNVAVGLRSIERAEIVGGLGADDKVIISPIGTLKEGQRVRTTWMDPRTAAGLNKPKEASNFKGFAG